MKYTVRVGSRTFRVDLTGHRVVVDGREVTAALHPVPGTPLRQLVLPDGAVTFAMERTEEGWSVQHHGERFAVEVVDERTRMIRELTGGAGGDTGEAVVKAPMPGLVLRLEVAAGARVAAGTPLLVLEAMKMENEIKAPAAGVITAVRVAAGQAVERGVPLVEIGPEEA